MKSYIWKGFDLGSQMAVVTQKTSEVVSALAQRQDVLEIELQELQQILLAMQVNTFFLIISLFFFVPTYPLLVAQKLDILSQRCSVLVLFLSEILFLFADLGLL